MFRHTLRIFLATAMLVAVPVGQTDDPNYLNPNTRTGGGENATVWEGIDPKGEHATATAVAWAGERPVASVTPDHPAPSAVPLMNEGDHTVWTGSCTLTVRRYECDSGVQIRKEIRKDDLPLRIEVRRVKKKYSDATKTGLTAGMLAALAAMNLPGVNGVAEAIVDGVIVGLGTGIIPLLLPDILGNEINRDVDADGNPAYLRQELWHHSAEGLTIVHSHGSASAVFAGDPFPTATRFSHSHDELDLHPGR